MKIIDNIENSAANEARKLIERRFIRYFLIRKIIIAFIIISIANFAFSYIFTTPKLYLIEKDNQNLLTKYDVLKEKIRTLHSQLEEIHHRDIHIYRALFAVDSLSIPGIYDEYPEEKYSPLEGDYYSPLMIDTWQNIDLLTKEIYQQSLSLDELQILAKNKENMSLAVPAIWPIDRTKLKALYSWGNRIHPIYHIRKFHKGVDLACKVGTPIYATGDAVVESTDKGLRRRGYGQQVLLNHEFGYKTRYAHLSKIFVKPGEHVSRGQLIGEVGSTGGSTGPHLHYEVIYNGSVVNPVNYFNKDMTAEEYQALMNNAKENEDLEQ